MLNSQRSCIVQRDFTVLLDTSHPGFEEARQQLSCFAELIKSLSTFYTYRMTRISLWNAAATGWSASDIVNTLQQLSKWDVPQKLIQDIEQLVLRYGKLLLVPDDSDEHIIHLECTDDKLLQEIISYPSLSIYWEVDDSAARIKVVSSMRGHLKQELMRLGYPVIDLVGYHLGKPLHFGLAKQLPDGSDFRLRSYQQDAIRAFEGSQTAAGGSGVLVLPCGAGKTVIGIGIMERFQCETLILTSNSTSVKQWINEIVSTTSLSASDIGEYSGLKKEVKPITVATYQILTHRKSKDDPFEHMKLFDERDWGLIIYDEVHLLPAPVFRATADIQATRRLGLTATLVREDGCEQDVFSLIGPKRFEVPWKELEKQGWIARVECEEWRVDMPRTTLERYRLAEKKEQFRIAAENSNKLPVIRQLLNKHLGLPALIIGQYIDQLKEIAAKLNAPLISGEMPQQQRNEWYAKFKEGKVPVIVVSKVANFAVDLPDAAVAIQVSGSFGSRQEEAQRLGRILRPKKDSNTAFFYTIVSQDTREQDFALRRQLFLIEQGYEYSIHYVNEEELGMEAISGT
ncbi:DNA repair helicase XPB [Paenibacillus sediminis]|uniref:DNA 3'-5' helicase n=1 Tax=Paenibacillus sediminis TaxID=664909 RepID=A0ABS4GZ65_9BACL|nr:DNA repair helicase XPB [Paenibacillus sediminis]MBP1935554.1 DNA excision repair protein ERCC-3 [Paenibacillus sediminis]